MILLRSHILGFGKLQDLKLNFQSGLNVLFSFNEGGKSTLQRSLVGLLYGQLRSDLKVQRRLDPWVEQYKPWHGSDYGGILWCRLADGREVEIHRSFGKEEVRIEIRTSTGEDIAGLYEQQRNGEVLFGRFHLGMSKNLFESVGVIRENRVAEIQGAEAIRDRIANLAYSGDQELSVRKSLEKIQQILDSIGSERAPTKPYKQALDNIEDLLSERKALEERRDQFQNWLEERNGIAGEISKLKNELSLARTILITARRREIACRIQSLEEIDCDLAKVRSEIESLGARANFPVDGLEELNQLVGARDSIAKVLNEHRAEKEAASDHLARTASQRQELKSYETLAESGEADKITEWFVSYLGVSLQADGLQKTLTRLHSDAGVLEKRLSELSPALRDSNVDWQRIAREAAEEEQNASRICSALAEKIDCEKASLTGVMRTALNRRILGGWLLILAITPSMMRFLAGFSLLPYILEILFGVILACFGAVLMIAASKNAKTARIAKQTLRTLEAEKNSSRVEGESKRKEFNKVIADSGFQSVDEFLEAARKSEQDRQRLADLKARSSEAENQCCQLQAQANEIFQTLKDSFARVGLSCSSGNLKFQIDLVRDNLRRFREMDAYYGSCVQKLDSLKAREIELANEYNLKCVSIQSLLDHGQVDTPERFREECLKRQRLLELLEKEALRKREFQGMAGKLTLQQWKDQLQELTEKERICPEETDSANISHVTGSGASAPPVPYLPTIAEAEEKEKEISSKLALAREEYARALERIQHAFHQFRTSSEIDEDLATAQRAFRDLNLNRRALSIALEILEKLSRQQQEVLAPQLNAAVEHRFLRLCRHRYSEVKIDPDFQVWVRESNTGELRLAEHLSRGTQDQLYLAIRFGILDLVSNADEPCPSFLDEPFAAYDRTRLREAFEVLREEVGRRQLFLFTCREDLLELAQQQKANVIRMRTDD